MFLVFSDTNHATDTKELMSARNVVLKYFSSAGKAATTDPVSIKSHFEELYAQKKEKQPDLETIKGMISSLLSDPEACDKNHIRDMQSDVCSKWHDFTELLIDLIIMQVMFSHLTAGFLHSIKTKNW